MKYNYKNLFVLGSFVSLLVLSINHIANILDLYYLYPRFDIFMHAFGGFAVGILSLSLLQKYNKSNIYLLIFLTFIVGFIWELLELYFKVSVLYGGNIYIDTIKDLIMDTLGGILSYICLKKR